MNFRGCESTSGMDSQDVFFEEDRETALRQQGGFLEAYRYLHRQPWFVASQVSFTVFLVVMSLIKPASDVQEKPAAKATLRDGYRDESRRLLEEVLLNGHIGPSWVPQAPESDDSQDQMPERPPMWYREE